MRRLIAIVSCHAPKFRALAEAQRQTWIPLVDWADVKFFLGRPSGPANLLVDYTRQDEVWLDVDDGYMGLPAKVQAMFRWSAEQNYEHTFKTDDDCYVVPEFLAQCPIADYAGRVREPSGTYPASYASGFAYHLSRRAAESVANGYLNKDWAEDRFIGNLLALSGFSPILSDTYSYMPASPPLTPEVIFRTNIRSRSVYCEFPTPELLVGMHEYCRGTGSRRFLTPPTEWVEQPSVTYEQFMSEPIDMPEAFKMARTMIQSRRVCDACRGKGECGACHGRGWIPGVNPIIVSA